MSDVPIADCADLSDCRTAALISRDRSMDWLGLPRFCSASCLGRLLDPGAGRLALRPSDPAARVTRRYLPETLILETTWTTVTRWIVALDGAESGHDLGRNSPGVLLRCAFGLDGSVPASVEWVPRPENGLEHPLLTRVEGGILAVGGPTQVLLSCPAGFSIAGDSAAAAVRHIEAGQSKAIALHWARGFYDAPARWNADGIKNRLASTGSAWRSWSRLPQTYRGPFADLVTTSGLVLQGPSRPVQRRARRRNEQPARR